MPERLLCSAVCNDGLKCGPEWPNCVNIVKCVERGGCFWRGWHGIAPDKMLLRHDGNTEKCDVPLKAKVDD